MPVGAGVPNLDADAGIRDCSTKLTFEVVERGREPRGEKTEATEANAKV
jgi:hypothetical protein